MPGVERKQIEHEKTTLDKALAAVDKTTKKRGTAKGVVEVVIEEMPPPHLCTAAYCSDPNDEGCDALIVCYG